MDEPIRLRQLDEIEELRRTNPEYFDFEGNLDQELFDGENYLHDMLFDAKGG